MRGATSQPVGVFETRTTSASAAATAAWIAADLLSQAEHDRTAQAILITDDGDFAGRCNLEMVDLDALGDDDDACVRELVTRHVGHTASPCGQRVLDQWTELRASFVKVMPRDYKRVLRAEAKARAESREPGFAELVGTAAY